MQKLSLFILIVVAFASGATAQSAPAKAKPRSYEITAAQSRIVVVLTQEGLIARRYANHRVEVREFAGRIEVAPDETNVRVAVKAEAKSLVNVDEAMSEFERREFQAILNNSVVESAKFPQITFASLSVSDLKRKGATRTFTLAGELTLHGVTRRISFPVTVAFGDDDLRATGEAKLRQSDFGMKPYAGGMGLIRIGDEVRVTLNVVARLTQ